MTRKPAHAPFLVASALALLATFAGLPAAGASGVAAQVARPGDGATQTFVVAATGNEARYRVREQLLGFDFPNDAVGATSRVSGSVAIDAEGRIVPAASRVVVDLSDLTSDSDRRDNFIKRRTLDTDTHPHAVFVPRQILGLDGALPASGEVTFRIAGEMTVRGVTRSTVWEVTARREGDAVTGTATTRFTFSRFDLEIPRVRSVLSVDDDIRLEYDFRFVPAG
jgi:polyisoprenoid-binding protein YceI